MDLFYEQESYDAAKRMCFGCPEQVSCIEAGLGEPYGVWGGLTPTERKQLERLVKEGKTL